MWYDYILFNWLLLNDRFISRLYLKESWKGERQELKLIKKNKNLKELDLIKKNLRKTVSRSHLSFSQVKNDGGRRQAAKDAQGLRPEVRPEVDAAIPIATQLTKVIKYFIYFIHSLSFAVWEASTGTGPTFGAGKEI